MSQNSLKERKKDYSAYQKEYREKNKFALKQKRRIYYEKNKHKIIQKQLAWYYTRKAVKCSIKEDKA